MLLSNFGGIVKSLQISTVVQDAKQTIGVLIRSRVIFRKKKERRIDRIRTLTTRRIGEYFEEATKHVDAKSLMGMSEGVQAALRQFQSEAVRCLKNR